MVCFRHIFVNTLHKGNINNNNNNNNNSEVSHIFMIPSHTQNLNIPFQHIIMAPNTGSTLRSSFPGLWKYPTYLKDPIKYAELWMEHKKVDDNTGGESYVYWTVQVSSSWSTFIQTQVVFGEFMMLFMTLLTGYINIQGDQTG